MMEMPERIVTVTNPVGTRQRTAHRAIDRLREAFGSRVIEQSTYPRQKDTTYSLKETVRAGDIVVTIGGDGTARTAVEALADIDAPAHEAYLLPLPFGFQNDLSRQLYGARRNDDPVMLIHDARVMELTPMKITVDHENHDEFVSALYSSVGFIATAAAHLESDVFRNNVLYRNEIIRDIYSLRVLPWALADRRRIPMTIDGQEREILDATIAKVPSLARYLHPPVTLVDNEAFYIEIRTGSLYEIGRYVTRLAVQPIVAPPPHQMLIAPDRKVITIHEATQLQTDGDAHLLVPETTVTFGLHDSHYRALSTKLT